MNDFSNLFEYIVEKFVSGYDIIAKELQLSYKHPCLTLHKGFERD